MRAAIVAPGALAARAARAVRAAIVAPRALALRTAIVAPRPLALRTLTVAPRTGTALTIRAPIVAPRTLALRTAIVASRATTTAAAVRRSAITATAKLALLRAAIALLRLVAARWRALLARTRTALRPIRPLPDLAAALRRTAPIIAPRLTLLTLIERGLPGWRALIRRALIRCALALIRLPRVERTLALLG